MATDSKSDALRGPWMAVLSDNHGFVGDSVAGFDDGESIEIAVVRGSALPKDGRRPGTWKPEDVLYELDVMDFDDEEEAAARWEQAQAVATALNAYAG